MAILVAYDGSRPAQKAVEHAIDEYGDREIVLLRVIEAAGGSTGAGISLAKEKMKSLRKEVSGDLSTDLDDLFETEGVDLRIEIVFGKPANEIVEFAEKNDEIEHIIVGNHGRQGMSRMFLGNVAEKVARRATLPVTIIR